MQSTSKSSFRMQPVKCGIKFRYAILKLRNDEALYTAATKEQRRQIPAAIGAGLVGQIILRDCATDDDPASNCRVSQDCCRFPYFMDNISVIRGLAWYGEEHNSYDSAGRVTDRSISSDIAYTYDQNGNAATRNGYQLMWSSYNYPTSINSKGKNVTFSYDPNRRRYSQVYSSGSGIETTMYVGGLLEKVTTGSTSDWRHYIRVGSQLVAIMSRQSTGTNATHYVLADHEDALIKLPILPER